jgi:hypothetical protein
MKRRVNGGGFVRLACVAATAALSLAAGPAAQGGKAPVVGIADPQSLNSMVTFGTLPPQAGGGTRGSVHWRLDIALPPHTLLDRADVHFSEPPVLHLSDGRCFRIAVDANWSARFHLKGVSTTQIDCPVPPSVDDPDRKPIDRAGMRYVGRAFDLDAYVDAKSGQTLLFQTGQQDSVPLLSTRIHVLALGAMGCPDCGATDLRLLGTIGGRLVLAEIGLNVAYA